MNKSRIWLQRSVGAGALILIGVAFFPLVFNAAGYEERIIESKIPALPHRQSPVTLQAPEPTANKVEEVAVVTNQPRVPSPVSELSDSLEALRPALNPSLDPPALDEDEIPAAWTLQLASFRQESNARDLRTRLLADGYKVYLRQSNGVIRIFVGPEMQKSRLESLQSTLKSEYGLEGMIIRFSTQ